MANTCREWINGMNIYINININKRTAVKLMSQKYIIY